MGKHELETSALTADHAQTMVLRMDPKLLRGIEHRGEEAHPDLALVRSRAPPSALDLR